MATQLRLTPAQIEEINQMADICSLPPATAMAYIQQFGECVELHASAQLATPKRTLATALAVSCDLTAKEMREICALDRATLYGLATETKLAFVRQASGLVDAFVAAQRLDRSLMMEPDLVACYRSVTDLAAEPAQLLRTENDRAAPKRSVEQLAWATGNLESLLMAVSKECGPDLDAEAVGRFRALAESLPVVEVLALGEPGATERVQLELFAPTPEALRLEWADAPPGTGLVGRMLMVLPHHVDWEGRMTFWYAATGPVAMHSTHSSTGEGLSASSGLEFEGCSATDTVRYADRFVQTRLAIQRLDLVDSAAEWDTCSDAPGDRSAHLRRRVGQVLSE